MTSFLYIHMRWLKINSWVTESIGLPDHYAGSLGRWVPKWKMQSGSICDTENDAIGATSYFFQVIALAVKIVGMELEASDSVCME
jgi:hypothetical protein